MASMAKRTAPIRFDVQLSGRRGVGGIDNRTGAPTGTLGRAQAVRSAPSSARVLGSPHLGRTHDQVARSVGHAAVISAVRARLHLRLRQARRHASGRPPG